MNKKTLPLGPLVVDLRGETLRFDEAEFLCHPAVGAVILFARNHRSRAQTSELVAEIKALRSPPLMVSVDQEGGDVQRLRHGFHSLPAAAKLGEVYDRDRSRALNLSRAAGELMAREVTAAGIDISFAPVLDRAHAHSRVIGARAFHHDSAAICELAGAYIDGMNRAGMSATGKHFPGHGGVAEDSHLLRPVDARAFAETESDLIPFSKLMPKLRGIMTAHILFPNIAAHAPAYSKFWLRHVLRERLQFKGMIFSDDLNMKGAGAGDGDGDGDGDDITARAKNALAAGCDMVLICNAFDAARAAADALLKSSAPLSAEVSPSLAEKISALRARKNISATGTDAATAAAETDDELIAELNSLTTAA